ncbi:enoyl-CoA hydratase-related protein [Vibrio sp. PP-XX7]
MFWLSRSAVGITAGVWWHTTVSRLVGLLPALNLILTGRKVRVKEAVKLGIVNASVDRDGLLDAARRMLVDKTGVPCRRVSWIAQIQQVLFKHQWVRHWAIAQARKKAQQKARHHYPAIDVILDVIQFGLDHGMTRGLVQEAQSFGLLAMTS